MSAVSPARRKAQALQRLQLSRHAMIVRLYPAPPTAATTASPPSAGPGDLLLSLAMRIRRDGLTTGLWRTARRWGRRWWRRQAWHASADLVVQAVGQEVRPLVHRHPWTSLALGAAAGAGLMALRPWLMRTLRPHVGPWRQHLGRSIWTQLSQPTVQLALAGALAAWVRERSAPPPSGPPPA